METPSFNFDDDADLTPREVAVTYQKKSYVLREPDEDAAVAYRSMKLTGVEMAHDEATETRTIKSMQALSDIERVLVSKCLFTQEEHAKGDKGRPVSKDILGKWPARVVNPLFQQAKEMGNLDEDPKAELADLEKQVTKLQKRIDKLRAKEGTEKNSSTAGPGTSA